MQIYVAIAHSVALMLLGLVTGSMFAIWQGHPIVEYSPATFVEVHQGAVRGLNTVLPALATAALLIVAALAIGSRRQPPLMWLYVLIAGLIPIGRIDHAIDQPADQRTGHELDRSIAPGGVDRNPQTVVDVAPDAPGDNRDRPDAAHRRHLYRPQSLTLPGHRRGSTTARPPAVRKRLTF